MRLSLLATTAALAATSSQATGPQHGLHQWIVIGTSGQLVEVDPQPYMPESRRLRKLQERQEEKEWRKNAAAKVSQATHEPARSGDATLDAVKKAIDDGFFDEEDDELGASDANLTESHFSSEPLIPDIETLIVASDVTELDAWHDDFDDDHEDVSDAIEEKANAGAVTHKFEDDSPMQRVLIEADSPSTFVTNLLVALEDESAFPAVQGSIVFAELSCLFVGFIAYLVHSIPLWSSFSFGQACCLSVAFGAAFLYQFVAIGWYYDFISPDVTLGISSLITRTISLGMVPITTTSFMGRARLAAELAATQDQPPVQVISRTKSSSRQRKARSN